MKRLFGFIILSLSIPSIIFSQIDIKSSYITITDASGLDNIYMFQKIDNSSEIHYTSSDASDVVKWYTFSSGSINEMTNVSTLSSTETYIDPVNNTGYMIKVNGQQVASFWVFDYSKYLPEFNTLSAEESDTPCEDVKLSLNANIPVFEYENLFGGKMTLNRKFTVKYETLEWNTDSWGTKEVSTTVILPNTSGIYVEVPLSNTLFTISGDEYGIELNTPSNISTLQEYITKAAKCNITTETVSRDNSNNTNENNRPDSETLNGSAPLDIHFYSNPTPAVDTYLWEIYQDASGTPFISRSAKDNIYTFTNAGTYKVKLTVSNQYCSYSDTVTVEVVESSLVVPKVFTPNGDGVQDEFKVAYQSIIEFDGIIYNRWGRKIYSWSDPSKGWDGTIGGRSAAIAPYYYLIKAKGSDGIKYKLKGCVNLLR